MCQQADRFHDEPTRHSRTGPHDQNAIRHDLARTTSCHQVVDIYLPTNLWQYRATDVFIERVLTLCPGATIYRGALGRWAAQDEETRVLRISVEVVTHDGRVVFDVPNFRTGIRDAATDLLVDLQANHGHVEQAIFFNDWSACGTLVIRG
jgi:hypothetical protein